MNEILMGFCMLINIGLMIDRYWIEPERRKEAMTKALERLKEGFITTCPDCNHNFYIGVRMEK